MRLESSIKELHDMFMDIAMLVENQVSGTESQRGERGEENSGFSLLPENREEGNTGSQ